MLTGQILLQLIIILIVVQIFGYLGGRIGQQWVIGEILAGLVLGPSLLGALFPGFEALLFPASVLPTLQTLGDIGLVLYMFSLAASEPQCHCRLAERNNPATYHGCLARILPLSWPGRTKSNPCLIYAPGWHCHGHNSFSGARAPPGREEYVRNEGWDAGADVCCYR